MSVTSSAKSFDISKRDVWDAYKRIKANRGAAGVDGQSITEFEEHLSANLYKLWNRLASGSYFPPPVRRVEIPKGDGRTRPLGIGNGQLKLNLKRSSQTEPLGALDVLSRISRVFAEG
jgi:retron-type reverse transcriptase